MPLRFAPRRGSAALALNAMVRGPVGPQGEQGIQGIQGIQGVTGDTGATGPGYQATSSTSNAIASSGSKSFTVQSGLAYSAGARARAADAALPSTNYMEGVVTSYSGTTLIFTADYSVGSGTFTSWTINLAGDRGAQGPQGDPGTMGGTLGVVDDVVPRASGTGGTTLSAGTFSNSDAGNVYPNASDTGALGTSTNMWADLFLASGGVINWNNGNYTITHSSGDLAFSGIVTLTNSGLHILDTNASHDLIITPGSDLTADRILTITTGDAARTITLSGNPTLVTGTAAVLAGGQTLTGGFTVTPFSAGTKSSGTYTPLYSDGNFQTATNGGAHTLAPPANDCTMIVQYTNNGSAGAITTSGFTKVDGSFTTVNGDDFFACITKVGSFSHLNIVRLQ